MNVQTLVPINMLWALAKGKLGWLGYPPKLFMAWLAIVEHSTHSQYTSTYSSSQGNYDGESREHEVS